MKRIVFVILSLTSSLSAVPVETFPFAIAHEALHIPTGKLFIGAKEAVANNNSAIASARRDASKFTGLTPAKVTINGKKDQTNPLHGQAITHLVMADRRPVVIAQPLPSTLFLLDDQAKVITLEQSDPLNDAQGNQAPSVLALTSSAAQNIAAIPAGKPLKVFAAVPNAAGEFNGNGSGISFAFFRKVDTQKFSWDIVDASTGASGEKGNKAKPLGLDTKEVFITHPLNSISNEVALHFDRDLGLLYIGLQAQAGAEPDAGVRSIVIASTEGGRLSFKPIAPDSAVTQPVIVGDRNPASQAFTYAIRTMQTRTHLRYLIVVGGNNDDSATQQLVSALPIVDNTKSQAHGMLADVTSLPVPGFAPLPPHRFLSRTFIKPATVFNELYSINAPAARVGGVGILPGPITDISVAGEAVFVSCKEDNDLNQNMIASGMFYSQPVFDMFGRISGWTDWQRVAGASETVSRFAYDPFAGIFWHLLPDEKGDSKTVFRTQWIEQDPLISFISSQLPQKIGGVQGFFDFPSTTESFSQDPQERLAVQIFTGYKKVILLQTGKQINGLFSPFMDLDDRYISKDGTLEGFQGASVLSLSGGVLDTIGPISSAAVVTDGINGWFVVAGSGGVAVLVDEQGQGWVNLGSNFSGLTQKHRWQIIRTTNFIRKLVSKDGQLFVLADRELERLDLSADAISAGTVPGVLLHQLKDTELVESFSDLYIKGPLAILATSTGLFRSGNGVDIQAAQNKEEAGWTRVGLLESVGSLTNHGPVTRLMSISTSYDDVQENIYVLNGYVGLCQALLYRLVITLNGEVDDTTVRLFPDFIIKSRNSFFLNLGDYRNFVVTDGSLIALSRSAFGGRRPLLELLPPGLKSGESAVGRTRVPFVILPENAQTIGQLIRSSASGTWMIPGDFGIRIQN